MSNATRGAVTGAASGAAQGFAVGGPWGAVVGGAIGLASGLMQGSAADDAEKLAEMQAYFSELETEENLRRMRLQAEHDLGLARSQVAASDIIMSGSSERYVDQMAVRHKQDQAWVEAAGNIQQRMILKGGQAVSSGIMTNMYSNQIRQVGSGLASWYSPGNGGGSGSGGGSSSQGWPTAGINYLKSEGIIG